MGQYSAAMDEDPPLEPIVDRAERKREERRAVNEAGGGSEGFELAEQALIQNTSHGDQHAPARIMRDGGPDEESGAAEYGEADEEHQAD